MLHAGAGEIAGGGLDVGKDIEQGALAGIGLPDQDDFKAFHLRPVIFWARPWPMAILLEWVVRLRIRTGLQRDWLSLTIESPDMNSHGQEFFSWLPSRP